MDTELEDLSDQYQGGFIWDYIDQAMYRIDESGEKHLVYGGDFDDRSTDYIFPVQMVLCMRIARHRRRCRK